MFSRDLKKEKCPPRLELSAFCDDCPATETTAPHVARCPECAEIVGDYRRIGDMIADLSREPPDPAALNARICAAVRIERAHPRYFRFSPGRLSKVAAVLVAGALTGVVGVNVVPRLWPGEAVPPQGGETVAHGGDGVASLPELPYYTGFNRELLRSNSIPIQHLTAANYGDNSPIFASAAGLAQPQVHIAIDHQVKQVWVMPETDSPAVALQELLDGQQIANSHLRRSRHGTWVLSAILSKEQLVKLVRLLDSQRFDLLSPAAPQPEQRYFIGKPTDMVRYVAEFVEN